MTDQLLHSASRGNTTAWVVAQDLQGFCATREGLWLMPAGVRGVWLQIVRVIPAYDLNYQKLPDRKNLCYGPLDQITVRVEDLSRALECFKDSMTVTGMLEAWIQHLAECDK